ATAAACAERRAANRARRNCRSAAIRPSVRSRLLPTRWILSESTPEGKCGAAALGCAVAAEGGCPTFRIESFYLAARRFQTLFLATCDSWSHFDDLATTRMAPSVRRQLHVWGYVWKRPRYVLDPDPRRAAKMRRIRRYVQGLGPR